MSKLQRTEAEGVFVKGTKFVAMAYVHGKPRFLGSYDRAEDAAAKIKKFAMTTTPNMEQAG
jgi:hypothetical protein